MILLPDYVWVWWASRANLIANSSYLIIATMQFPDNDISANNEEQAGGSIPAPQIDIEISFDRSTHSYSQHTEPPKITLTVTSRADHPLTIFTWRKPVDPKGALNNEGYTITDIGTGQGVKTVGKVQINRPGIKRVRGHSDEQYFLTLLPNTPSELSTGTRTVLLAPFKRTFSS